MVKNQLVISHDNWKAACGWKFHRI